MELFPNSLSFRVVTTLELEAETPVPAGFTGRARFVDRDDLVAVGWYVHGELHDPARDVPAYVRLRPNGRIKQARYYRNGRLHDPATGSPAVIGYFADGNKRYEEHYVHGHRQDAPTGAPAIVKWRHDGSVRSVRRYPPIQRRHALR